MPRTGLSSEDVVAAAAALADEAGFRELTMGLLAERLGVRTPSLYKHVADLADLRHRVAALAMAELGEAVRDALQGKSGLDALDALLTTVRGYVTAHPGRYTATIGAKFTGPDDPLLAASLRVIGSITAVLRGYGISDAEMDHAIRTIRCTIHGYAVLQAGEGFQWSGDPGKTFDWMTRFIDGGLRAARSPAGDAVSWKETTDVRAAGRADRPAAGDAAALVPVPVRRPPPLLAVINVLQGRTGRGSFILRVGL